MNCGLFLKRQKMWKMFDGLKKNGLDMYPHSSINIMYWRRLWRELKISSLTYITYPAGHSVYNPIEHAWSPLSNALTLVVITVALQAEDQPPNRQTHLTKDEL